MGAYLRKLTTLMNEYGYRSPIYGHFGQGCAHLRINFDLRSAEGLRQYREFIVRAADLVLSFGGSLSGEHGDGQSRAALLPRMFGPELMAAFRDFKTLWDPDNRMNPGKLVDAVRVYDPVENLRYGPAVPGQAHTELETHFVFAKDEGSLERATERCVGVGACRQSNGGVMCPSYRATGEEQHSTRGRARLLWEMLAGALQRRLPERGGTSGARPLPQLQGMQNRVPGAGRHGRLQSRVLAQRYKGHVHPLHHYVFGFADRLARLGALAPALTNALLTGPVTSPLVKRILGVAQERQMPRLAARSYSKIGVTMEPPGKLPPGAWEAYKASGQWSGEAPVPPPAVLREAQLARPQVVLWPDTWNNYYHPQTLVAAEKVLTQAGFRVQIPQGHLCCGRPLYDFGLLDAARGYLAKVLGRMAPQIDAGMPFIFLEPSCASVFKDELPELLANDPRAQRLSQQVWLLADWLAAKAPDWATGRLTGAHILLHGHCHHKAVFGGPAKEIELLRQAGATVEAIRAGCCGMAGPFGFEADKFEVSKPSPRTACCPPSSRQGPER